MSIRTTCDRCFETFQVKEEFAGRTVRCKACGVSITVPSNKELFDEASEPPRPRRRTRKRRSNAAPKIAAIIVACLTAVALLSVGIWFLATQIGGSEHETRETRSDPLAAEFAKPPHDPRIQVSNDDWVPGEARMGQLAGTTQVGDFEFRLPRDMRRTADRKLGTDHYLFRWRKGNCVAIVLQIQPADNWTAERIEHDLLSVNERRPSGSPLEEDLKVVRGKLSGRVCYRKTSAIQNSRCGRVFGVEYSFLDSRGRLIGITLVTTADSGSGEYRLLDSAVRTIHER